MKLQSLKALTVGTLLITSMANAGITYANEREDHSPATAGAEQSLPGTIVGIWQAIDQKTAELKQLIQSGSLANVHHVAYAVRDLVAALAGPLYQPARRQAGGHKRRRQVCGNPGGATRRQQRRQ